MRMMLAVCSSFVPVETAFMAKESVGAARGSRGGARSLAQAKVSDRLEEDAHAMEERLAQLRIKMVEDKQRLEKERPAKFGGSRWRSAQEDIGSVSRYAKDIEQKKKGRSVKASRQDAVANGSDADAKKEKEKKKKKKTTSSRPTSVLSMAGVRKWTTQQVGEWLAAVELEEFQSAFEYHNVTGPVLLQLELDELTQIGVNRLAARNRIWTELEAVKQEASAARQYGKTLATEIVDSKIRDVAVVPECSSPAKNGGQGVHWSQLKPLRDENVDHEATDVPVNLADGDFDEDASHASFLRALLDWRTGDDENGNATTGNTDEGGGNGDAGMWFNPINQGGGKDENDNNAGGGALLEGDYDEAKEQEAFRRAVDAWRSAGKEGDGDSTRPTSAASTAADQVEQGSATDEPKSCWQCYRVVSVDILEFDPETKKSFCGRTCMTAFRDDYAHLYQQKHDL